jgi:hypothetical protein
MQREHRGDPRHLPSAEERTKTNEPLNKRAGEATADAERTKRRGADTNRPNNPT